jgi:cyanate permease
MNDVINGQIVPALGQWQGTILIIASLSLVSLLRWFYGQIVRRMIRPKYHD